MRTRSYLFICVLVLIICTAVYFLLPVYKDYRQSQTQVDELQAEISRLEVQSQELEREIRALRTDPQAVERVAREKFGWCRDNEKVYHFDPAPAPDATGKSR
jgi:cell division protein FtsL